MMTLFDLHTHTTFCDGQNTPEEMAEAALQKNFGMLGFSGHAYTPFDADFCMSRENTALYTAEIQRLKSLYDGKIKLYLGCERDFFSDDGDFRYDYVIGSVHYVKKDGVFLSVDNTAEIMQKNVAEHYGGDYMEYIRDFFSLAAECPKKTGADIIGHFDIVTKFNEGNRYFDEQSDRYRRLALEALDAAAECRVPFEVNIGAVYRGYRKAPYPNRFLLEEIRRRGGCVTLSGDCHTAAAFGFGFYESLKMLSDIGFDSIAVFNGNGFEMKGIDDSVGFCAKMFD